MSAAPIVAVYGASRGIGKAICEAFAKRGATVVVVARNKDNVDSSVNSLPSGKHLGISCDVSDSKQVQLSVDEMMHNFGRIDVLVNAAGINRDALLLRSSNKDISEVLHTNLIGSINTSKAILKPMLQQKQGSIINIGSIIGLQGNSGQTVYSASKAGLVGFSKSLAKEVGSRGIRVNLIAPGFIKTDMTSELENASMLKSLIPLQKFGYPEDIANVVLFISTSASYITGQVLIVDGGLHLSL